MTGAMGEIGDRPDFELRRIAYGDAEPAPEPDLSPQGSSDENPLPKRSENVSIRAEPKRAVGFRKGLLIASAAGVLSGLAVLAWIALEPAGLEMAADARDLTPAGEQGSPEELAGLPQSYGESGGAFPVLGQPLPGDLGRPILEQQRTMASEAVIRPPQDPAVPDIAAQGAAVERQRRLAELAQARSAPVLMQVSRNSAGGSEAAPPAGDQDRLGVAGVSLADDGTNPGRLRPPASRWQIAAGSTIAASLITGLNSDLPGMVVAQITDSVYDSATGRAVLIPQGARLLGKYDSKVAFGQRRAMLVWERVVLPDGSSITLDNAPATDAAGYSGLADEVNFHTWQLVRGIGMSTLLGIGTELTFGKGEADLVRALRESVQSNTDRAGQKIVERNLDIAPTITVRPGFPVLVLVHKDLVLPPWRG